MIYTPFYEQARMGPIEVPPENTGKNWGKLAEMSLNQQKGWFHVKRFYGGMRVVGSKVREITGFN